MNNKKSLLIRIIIVSSFVIGFIILAVFKLSDLQIKNSEYYKERANKNLSGNTPIFASRGEIVDRNGQKLVSNTMAFIIRFNKSNWDTTIQNQQDTG